MQFGGYVGIPYVDKGRGADGCDCWGLVRLVYLARQIELPSYDEGYVTGADRHAVASLIAGELDPWEEVDAGQERPLDAVLMREGAMARHMGVVTEPGLVLHVEPDGDSKIERYRVGALKNRIVAFYRYRAS